MQKNRVENGLRKSTYTLQKCLLYGIRNILDFRFEN